VLREIQFFGVEESLVFVDGFEEGKVFSGSELQGLDEVAVEVEEERVSGEGVSVDFAVTFGGFEADAVDDVGVSSEDFDDVVALLDVEGFFPYALVVSSSDISGGFTGEEEFETDDGV